MLLVGCGKGELGDRQYRKLAGSVLGILKGLDRRAASERALRWLERVGLPDVAGKRCEELSKGMQQKVQFIAAVMHEPELLILDEPFSGLDPVNMRLMRGIKETFDPKMILNPGKVCYSL